MAGYSKKMTPAQKKAVVDKARGRIAKNLREKAGKGDSGKKITPTKRGKK